MEKMRKIFCALVAAGLCISGAAGAVSITDKFIGIGTEVITDPATFMFDLHQNTDDLSPIPVGKSLEFGMALFPSFLPLTMLNGQAKGRVLREHGGFPQLDVAFGGWTPMALWFIPVSDKPSVYGWHIGTVVSQSLDPRMRLFAGYEYTQVQVKVNLDMGKDEGEKDKEPSDSFDVLNWKSLSTLNVGKADHFLVGGAELLRSSNSLLISQLYYGLINDRIVARLTWRSGAFDSGIIFYPESAWVIYPFETFKVRF